MIRIKFLTKVLYRPSVMFHCFFLCKRLQFSVDFSIAMNCILAEDVALVMVNIDG